MKKRRKADKERLNKIRKMKINAFCFCFCKNPVTDEEVQRKRTGMKKEKKEKKEVQKVGK